MKLAIACALSAMSLAACGKKGDDNKQPPPTPGSAAAAIDAAAPPVAIDAAATSTTTKTLDADGLAKRYLECWSFWNAGKDDDFRTCYTPGAINDSPGTSDPGAGIDEMISRLDALRAGFPDQHGEPQLVLVSGHTVIGMVLLTGTNTGAMKNPGGELPATNHKIGMFLAPLVEVDDAGNATHESDYFDEATLTGQLVPDKAHAVRAVVDKPAPLEIVTSKGDATEKANLDAYRKLIATSAKHDAKGFAGALADDVVWFDASMPKDLNKTDAAAFVVATWKNFPTLTTQKSWAAGPYVAATESMEGAVSGKKLTVPILTIYKLDGGKVKRAWSFYQVEGLHLR